MKRGGGSVGVPSERGTKGVVWVCRVGGGASATGAARAGIMISGDMCEEREGKIKGCLLLCVYLFCEGRVFKVTYVVCVYMFAKRKKKIFAVHVMHVCHQMRNGDSDHGDMIFDQVFRESRNI
ncbi:hypothetical protein HanIR_Chr03g0147001 [Helianthus annuus]|nr:hypothetical protein HanIR_Chr03g0147001 [Helianthus annuus]